MQKMCSGCYACVFFFRYLGSNTTGMAILDVGLFSGFEAYKEDLEKVSTRPVGH